MDMKGTKNMTVLGFMMLDSFDIESNPVELYLCILYTQELECYE